MTRKYLPNLMIEQTLTHFFCLPLLQQLENKDQIPLKKEAEKKGFYPVGIAIIPGSRRIKMRTDSLERWIESGNHADMEWMTSRSRIEAEILLKGVKSVLVGGLNYFVLHRLLSRLSIERDTIIDPNRN